jgi:hypothetical protein
MHIMCVLVVVIAGADASSATDEQPKGETQRPHHRQRDQRIVPDRPAHILTGLGARRYASRPAREMPS